MNSSPGPEVVKLFSCSAEHEIYHVKMPTIVGILTFISMINTTSEGLTARNVVICPYFEPRHEISNIIVCATSKGSDQPAHTCRLIRAFASLLNIL